MSRVKPKPKPKPKRGRKPSTSVEAVVDAAVAILANESDEALTMRRLAEELELSPMALYRYVHDKDELLDRVVDTVLLRVEVAVRGDWRARLKKIADNARRVLLAHPGVAEICVHRPTPVVGVARIYAGMLEALRELGLDDGRAMHALDTITMFLFGSLLWQSPRSENERSRLVKVTRDRPDAALAPVNRNAALARRNPDEYFERGLALILDGIAASVRS